MSWLKPATEVENMFLGFFPLKLWLISGLSFISAWLSFKMQYGSVILSGGELGFFLVLWQMFLSVL